jgi:hypothetical protein
MIQRMSAFVKRAGYSASFASSAVPMFIFRFKKGDEV